MIEAVVAGISPPMRAIVVSGVSGSGKSTIGSMLAARLGRPFLDADDLHPATNVAKMTAGVPLSDEDRWPWFDTVGRTAQRTRAIVACSALRLEYRLRLRQWAPDVVFVQLSANPALIRSRLSARVNHFMPVSLLESQFALLEPLTSDEKGIVTEVDAPPLVLVERIINALQHEQNNQSNDAAGNN